MSSEWGFYCDVETGDILETPYIFTTCPAIGRSRFDLFIAFLYEWINNSY
jgi:hypothetical protein